MSRVARKSVELPSGVEVNLSGSQVSIKGNKGILTLNVHADVQVEQRDDGLSVKVRREEQSVIAIAGTTRALLANMIQGVTAGFERKLELRGVGYRAAVQGNMLKLTLGFSHPVNYQVPEGITVETPSQTEVVVSGVDKQKVGQVAAEIRAYRPPEPYKGKGVRYADERVLIKEAKKK